MKHGIEKYERWPDYCVVEGGWAGTIDLTDAELADWKSVLAEYDAWQERLEAACKRKP